MAAGIGWSWGAGTLTLLDESQHQFKVSGLDVVAVGIKQTTGVGDVYHVKNLKVQAAVSYELAEEIPLVK